MSNLKWDVFAGIHHLIVDGTTVAQIRIHSDGRYYAHININTECENIIRLNATDIDKAKKLTILEVSKYCSKIMFDISRISDACIKEILKDD